MFQRDECWRRFVDSLTAHGQAYARLHINYDIRNSAADTSQRMLNAIEPGSVVPVHRHRATSETVVVLRGRVVEEYYSPDGVVEAVFEVSAGGPVCAHNIPAGTWHTLRALERGTVILEMKDGVYEPMSEENILTIG